MTRDRLSLSTWSTRSATPLPDGVQGPGLDPRELSIGQVHLGLGAFHRAHQEVCTQDAVVATGQTGWGVLGVTQRSPRVADELAPQDGLYGVLTLGARETSLRLVGTLRETAYPGRDTARVVATLAAPGTHVVTLTVTEKGYRRAAGGGLDRADAATTADLAALRAALAGPSGTSDDLAPARTPVGLLLLGLARRAREESGPLTVLCCDNLADNGASLRALVHSWLDHTPGSDRLRAWLDASVRFPGTMVDRIVPATEPQHHDRAAALLGLRDEGLVVAEPFLQWVIEDDFAGPRPAWESAGATLTADVAPYERAKLRVLNGSHSALAYLGALRGHATIAGAVEDPELAGFVRELVDQDVLPTLTGPPGLDLRAYRDEVLARFANPHTGHTTVQVAMDGSQKLPQRLLGTARDRLAQGATPTAAATAVAAWVAYVRAASAGTLRVAGRPVALDDPLAPALARATDGPLETVVDRVLGLREVFTDDLRDSPQFRDAVGAALRTLAR
ncbi:mannitol dehydrogenase family protein [Cellulomonas hominis]